MTMRLELIIEEDGKEIRHEVTTRIPVTFWMKHHPQRMVAVMTYTGELQPIRMEHRQHVAELWDDFERKKVPALVVWDGAVDTGLTQPSILADQKGLLMGDYETKGSVYAAIADTEKYKVKMPKGDD